MRRRGQAAPRNNRPPRGAPPIRRGPRGAGAQAPCTPGARRRWRRQLASIADASATRRCATSITARATHIETRPQHARSPPPRAGGVLLRARAGTGRQGRGQVSCAHAPATFPNLGGGCPGGGGVGPLPAVPRLGLASSGGGFRRCSVVVPVQVCEATCGGCSRQFSGTDVETSWEARLWGAWRRQPMWACLKSA